jgi:hypothetical protein
MTEQADLERMLRSVLGELRPYQSDIVLIGGWVPYLYRHYGGFKPWRAATTLTFELDVLVPRPLAPEGRILLAELLRRAGFTPEREGGPAAVWVRDVEAGEKIEFIASHRGTAHGHGQVVRLEEQPGVGAVPLVELQVMAEHSRVLVLPPLLGLAAVKVRVPTLGAYVVNKALTFVRRQTRLEESGAPKMAKDLLYLHDLMCAGEEVTAAIAADVDRIAKSPGYADRLRNAASNLGFVVSGHLCDKLTLAARMAGEREGFENLKTEEARMRGNMLDLHEILSECADRHAPLEESACI